MEILSTIVGSLLLVVGCFVMTMNWAIVISSFTTKKHSSWVPIFGGALAALGAAVLPYAPLNKFWWVPLIVDWGCVPGLTLTMAYFAWRYVSPGKDDK